MRMGFYNAHHRGAHHGFTLKPIYVVTHNCTQDMSGGGKTRVVASLVWRGVYFAEARFSRALRRATGRTNSRDRRHRDERHRLALGQL